MRVATRAARPRICFLRCASGSNEADSLQLGGRPGCGDRPRPLSLRDALASPPGNRLERLRGDRAGYHSIRVNDQFRVVSCWRDGAEEVDVIDDH
ncbi:MAG TPA: type II toxin-antitoxin system RelE/ParE family toxin [Thermoanaerobaculia bacterium]|nr:type II toxin-antitoxin system RelE/ParE family toxin [Thermoanaerobaculia bacterium]